MPCAHAEPPRRAAGPAPHVHEVVSRRNLKVGVLANLCLRRAQRPVTEIAVRVPHVDDLHAFGAISSALGVLAARARAHPEVGRGAKSENGVLDQDGVEAFLPGVRGQNVLPGFYHGTVQLYQR